MKTLILYYTEESTIGKRQIDTAKGYTELRFHGSRFPYWRSAGKSGFPRFNKNGIDSKPTGSGQYEPTGYPSPPSSPFPETLFSD